MRIQEYQNIMRKVFKSSPGNTFSEKILYYPELLHKRLPSGSILPHRIKVISDAVSEVKHRYVLDDEVSGASLAISETRSSNLEKVIPHIRLPHEKFLIEFDEKGRIAMSNVATAGNKLPSDTHPDRTCFIIKGDETGRKGVMEMACIDRMSMNFYSVCLKFDLDDPKFSIRPYDKNDLTRIDAFMPGYLKNGAGEPTETWLKYTQLHQGMVSSKFESRDTLVERIKKDEKIQNATGELFREFRSFLSIMGMFALKNGISWESVATDTQTRNAKGSLGRRLSANQDVKPETLRIRMSLRREHKNATGKKKGPSSRSGLHWVCGHFKVRKTGVYWWSPHLRGDAERDLTEIPREIKVVEPQDPHTFPEFP